MNLSDFNYNLPSELIALHPPLERGTTNLLVLNKKTGDIEDKKYQDISNYLNPGDVLVLNDTKVMKCRLFVEKENGSSRELVVLEKHYNDSWTQHKVMYKGSIGEGEILTVKSPSSSKSFTLTVKKILGDGLAIISSDNDLTEIMDLAGVVPLPPYMKRDAISSDIERYQTVWADKVGSAAAPTASLNMTNDMLLKLQRRGVDIKYLTLHVGLGTFMPIRVDKVENHKMHKEYFVIPKATISSIQKAKSSGKKVVAVGTTVARTLEYSKDRLLSAKMGIFGEADIFIYPGYKFDIVDNLLTNFHAPRSTVLMLAAAFAGWNNLHNAYGHAIAKNYSFLSYGDSMFIY